MTEYSICTFEEAVEKTVLSGKWTPGLRAHVEGCSVCQDTLLVMDYRQSAAGGSELQPVLPTAAYIWHKARLIEKQAIENLVTHWMIKVRGIAYQAFSVAVVGSILYNWPQASDEIVHFSSEFLAAFSSGVTSSTQVLVYLTCATFVLNIVLTFWLFGFKGKLQK